MSAREQARDRAISSTPTGPLDGDDICNAADAASDVWEPLLRRLLDAIEETSHMWGGGRIHHNDEWRVEEMREVLAAGKEALG